MINKTRTMICLIRPVQEPSSPTRTIAFQVHFHPSCPEFQLININILLFLRININKQRLINSKQAKSIADLISQCVFCRPSIPMRSSSSRPHVRSIKTAAAPVGRGVPLASDSRIAINWSNQRESDACG